MDFIVRVEEDLKKGGFLAYIKTNCKDLSLCVSKGNTEIEAIKNLISVYEDILKIHNSSK